MARDAMVAIVRRRVGEDSADFWNDTTDIVRELDLAVAKLANEEDWSWLNTFNSTAFLISAPDVVLPNDIDPDRIVTARIVITGEQPYKINKVTPADGFRLMSTYTSDAHPRWYFLRTTAQSSAVHVSNARLVPEPDVAGAIEFLYYRAPAALTTGTQEPDIPERLHEAIVARACAELWKHELRGHEVKAAEQQAIYDDLVENERLRVARLGEDEQLAWGKMDDERERAGGPFPFQLPSNYGVPGAFWDE